MSLLDVHEDVANALQANLGTKVGISEACFKLRAHGQASLARRVACENKVRRIAAHADRTLAEDIQAAFAQKDKDVLLDKGARIHNMLEEAKKAAKIIQNTAETGAPSAFSCTDRSRGQG